MMKPSPPDQPLIGLLGLFCIVVFLIFLAWPIGLGIISLFKVLIGAR